MAKVRIEARAVGSVTDYLRASVGDSPELVASAHRDGLAGKVVCRSSGPASNHVEVRGGERLFVVGGGQAKAGAKGGRPPGALWARGELVRYLRERWPRVSFEELGSRLGADKGHLCESLSAVEGHEPEDKG
jgi:hypothetical protein